MTASAQPEFSGAPDTARDQALAEALSAFLDRQSQGEEPDIEAFCRENSSLLPELRSELETLAGISAVLEPEAPELLSSRVEASLPERLSGHKILSEIGSGGMGRVLLAQDERLNRKVAIKVLAPRFWPDALLASRFMQEARAMAQLSHPHIANIFNLGASGEPPHFVMEYIQGAPLTEAASALHLPQRMELFSKVVRAVDFLHRHGIIHRDLKPANVLVGTDLEPKVLDFGLALRMETPEHLTRHGEVLGTRDYFSPEQAQANPVDARSDVFALGVILYELLTERVPFRGETLRQQIQLLCSEDPVLPRRIDKTIPGDLQSICLKALEKNPANRYGSAREMADDLQRFLASEPVLAEPAAYSRIMTGKIEQHLRELSGWAQDHLLSDQEMESFRKQYDRLTEREDAWIMQVRRLSFSQVTLYFGAWMLVLGAALVVLFDYRSLAGFPAILVIASAAAATAWIGIRCWEQGQRRIGVAYLLTSCLLLPILLMVGMGQFHILAQVAPNKENLEFLSRFESFRKTTNAQVWWALALALPCYFWLRRFTRSSVFSLVTAFMGVVLFLVTLLRMGMLEWIDNDPGRTYLYFLPFAVLLFLIGGWIDYSRFDADARYFYFFALSFTYLGLSGIALFHAPYANWLKSVAPITRGQEAYLFIINAGIYFVLQHICDRLLEPQFRWVGKTFRFVLPGHILTTLLVLGISASSLWHDTPENAALRHEARFFEVLLPLAACAFVFGSIPKQMKNFLGTGLLFLAIGIIRLQQDLLRDRALWPVSLLLVGLLLMTTAANYPFVKSLVMRPFRVRK